MSKKSDERHHQRETEWLRRSLEQLEGSRWGDPSPGDTPLVTDCMQLRRVPVGELTLGNMRRLLLQDIGSKFLARRVVPLLQKDPFAKADLYPGDLLSALSHAIIAGWQPDPEMIVAIRPVLNKASAILQRAEVDSGQRKLKDDVRSALAALDKVQHGTNR
jgi:hypothetical protein